MPPNDSRRPLRRGHADEARRRRCAASSCCSREKSGWSPADQQAADALAKNGAMVVGVDTARYAARLNRRRRRKACHNLVGDAEAVSHQLERGVQIEPLFRADRRGHGAGRDPRRTHCWRRRRRTPSRARLSLDAEQQLDARFDLCPPDPTIIARQGLAGLRRARRAAGGPHEGRRARRDDRAASAGASRDATKTSPTCR